MVHGDSLWLLCLSQRSYPCYFTGQVTQINCKSIEHRVPKRWCTLVGSEVSIPMVSSTKSQCDFSTGFGIFADSKLCDKQEFAIGTLFFHKIITQIYKIFRISEASTKNLISGYKCFLLNANLTYTLYHTHSKFLSWKVWVIMVSTS